MAIEPQKIEAEFIEAKSNWKLEKLYVDLGLAKGKALTPVEKKFLRGLLCGLSPAEIAKVVYQSNSSSTVRVYLSNGLYKYIEEMLSKDAGYGVKVKSWSRVTQLLEKAGYKQTRLEINSASDRKMGRKKQINPDSEVISIQDWGEAVDVSRFYGRTQQLTQVLHWIASGCRLIALVGMGGIGKTAFSVKLAQQIQDNFEFVIWRSLNFAPTPEILIRELIQTLSPTHNLNSDLGSSISQLINYLRSHRCLIVLDNFDSILESGSNTEEYLTATTNNFVNEITSESQICYRRKYQGYAELLRRVGNSQHQSCVLITSREKPLEIAVHEGEKLPVRCLKLTGLEETQIREILASKGLSNVTPSECQLLWEWYGGNPLFTKLVATAIQELFNGKITEFIQQGTIVFGDMSKILDQQFNRLSPIEKQIMYWLGLNQDEIFSIQKLHTSIVPLVSQKLILESIELLQRRSLIDRVASRFTQTPVLIEYIAERLIEENFKLSQQNAGSLLIAHTIFETQLRNYIRETRVNSHG